MSRKRNKRAGSWVRDSQAEQVRERTGALGRRAVLAGRLSGWLTPMKPWEDADGLSHTHASSSEAQCN